MLTKESEDLDLFERAGICALVLSLASQSGFGADAYPWSVGVGFDYSSGTYGESQSTDILYIPVIGKYEIEDWAFKLTVPYISGARRCSRQMLMADVDADGLQ